MEKFEAYCEALVALEELQGEVREAKEKAIREAVDRGLFDLLDLNAGAVASCKKAMRAARRARR